MSTESFGNVPPAVPGAPAQEDRTVAILSYITLIGFIVAIILHSSKKTELGSFHLRQVLGMIIASFGIGIAVAIMAVVMAFIPVIGPILVMILWFGLWAGGIVLFVMGLIAAINGKQTPLPLIGAPIQKYLANTFT